MGPTRLFLAQRGLCFHCARPMLWRAAHSRRGGDGRNDNARWTRDHLLPRSCGGRGSTNLVLAHRLCNRDRAATMPTPAMVERARRLWALAVAISADEVERFGRDRSVSGTFCAVYPWPAAPGATAWPDDLRVQEFPS